MRLSLRIQDGNSNAGWKNRLFLPGNEFCWIIIRFIANLELKVLVLEVNESNVYPQLVGLV